MDYKVLYRKYRPNNFDTLVGQEHIKSILKNSIINNKIAHAYIFTGPRGTGKTSTAKIFAKAINCTNCKDGIACGECENCKNFLTTPDIIEIDAASNNGVDNIRDIKENVEIAPTLGKYKIYIIDEVHMLSTSAWNAFLKTLEEPPQNVIFILATTDIQKVPITVLSRCQRFDFSRIDSNLIVNNLKNICEKENIKYTDDALNEISLLSEGCMRDALSILDQLSKVSDEVNVNILKKCYGTVTNEDIDNIYLLIVNNDIDDLLNLIKNIKNTGIDIKQFIYKILNNFINKAIEMKKKNVSNNGFNHIKQIINALNDLLNRLNSNSDGYLMLELELISFINDENNTLSNRDINQIISREIILDDKNVDINNFINRNNKSIYNICDKFIDIRINNAFVNANKDLKIKFLDEWNNFINEINKNELNEFKNIVEKSQVQVVGEQNVLFITNNESTKLIANSKLYDLEIKFNKDNKNHLKFIFISSDNWKNYLKNYDKNKIYEYIDDSEYINSDKSSIKMAEDIFGNDKINLE